MIQNCCTTDHQLGDLHHLVNLQSLSIGWRQELSEPKPKPKPEPEAEAEYNRPEA